MSSNDPWVEVEAEFDRLRNNDSYKLFQPLFDSIQPMINTRYPSADAASGLLLAIKKLQLEISQGVDIRERIDEIKGGFIEPDWNIAGNVNQANRDIVINTIIQVFQNNENKLRLPDPTVVRVPVVLMVMRAIEAQQLISETAFKGYPKMLVADFRKLREFLDAEGIMDWVQRYRDTSEAWQPFSSASDQATIEQLVTTSLNTLNYIEGFQPPLVPDFRDIRTLHNNRYALRRLRSKGCVVIVDSISMRHPAIQRAFQQSMLDAYPKTSLVTIAPIQKAFETARDLRIVLQLRLADMEFAKRRVDKYEEYGTSREIYEKQEFEQWLLDRVRKMDLPVDRTKILQHINKF